MFKNKALVVFLIFLVVGLIIYANSFNNTFFWDDDDSIVNNTYIKDWKHTGKFFSKNLIDGAGQTTNYWRPLVLVSFSLDYHIWGLMPVGFHLTNTLLHIISAFLLFLFLYNLFEQSRDDGQVKAKNFFVVFLVSLFFLVHPLQTEAVTYVAGRADSLSTVFSLLSLIFYIYFRKGTGKQTGKYIASIMFFILGLLTKEQVILLPLLILLVELTVFTKKFNKKSIFEAIRRTGLFFAISVFYFISRITVLNFKESFFDFSSYEDSGYSNSIFYRLLTFSFVIISYFKLLLVPTGLHMAREVTTITSVFSPYVLSFVALLVLIIVLCVKTWKKERLISFGFLWFFIILLPRTNILKINRAMYEHWLYLPMAGFFLSVFLLILFFAPSAGSPRQGSGQAGQVESKKKKEIFETSFYTIFLILAFIFCILTIGRNKDWKDPITFYEKNLRYTPNSYIQHNNLGMAYAQIGRSDIAIEEYKKAIEIKDVYPQVHYNYANSLFSLKKYQEAEVEYKKAIEMSPEFLAPYVNLFSIYLSSNDADKALELIDQGDEVFGDNINYLKIKVEVYYYLGHEEEAKEVLEKISEK